jgi:hypothetical protein
VTFLWRRLREVRLPASKRHADLSLNRHTKS